MGSRGPSGTRVASRPPKALKKLVVATPFGGHLGDFSWLVPESFYDVFLGPSFSAPERLLGASRVPNGSKMMPKATKKEVRRQLVERARTMVVTVWEAHGEVSGRAWEPLFPRSRREGLSEGFRRGPRIDFLLFWMIFGVLWETIFGEKVLFFGGPVFS